MATFPFSLQAILLILRQNWSFLVTNYRKTSKRGYLTMGKFCGNANVNTAVLVPTEERVAGGITLPDREFATKEFPHSSCRFIAKFISRVLLWSLLTVVRNTVRQLSRLVVQLQSKLINQVKTSFLRWYQGDFSLRSTWHRRLYLVKFHRPWGKLLTLHRPF